MSEENKISLIRAAEKLKRAKKNRPSQSDDNDDSKARRNRNRDDNSGLSNAIINAVHRLKRD